MKVMDFILVLFSAMIMNICCEDLSLLNYDDEINSIFADILNGEYDTRVEGEGETKNLQEDEPQLINGVWKCGNCSDIDESKILLRETLDLDTNYEDTAIELQIGFSVSNMRCIAIETGAIDVRRVSGACAGDDVTLSVVQNSHIEVKIYQ